MIVVFFNKDTGEEINNAETFVVDKHGKVFGLFDTFNGYYEHYEVDWVGFRLEQKDEMNTKKLRLDELIQYIFDNDIEDKEFYSDGDHIPMKSSVRISGSGNIKIYGYINEETTFTVEDNKDQ